MTEMTMTVSDAPPVVSVRGLVATRGTTVVLDHLDLDVQKGEVIAVRGASGSGKSTLLAVLSGLLRCEAGEVSVDGTNLTGASERVRSAMRLTSLGLVFQNDELLPELTISENVTLPLRLSRRPVRKSQYRVVADPLLHDLGIDELADRMPSDVSGGQLQRAAIARAVIHKPAVILADEPTGSLDETAARAAISLLINLARERRAAVVVVTHDDAVARSCDRQVELKRGRLSPVIDKGDLRG